MTGCRNRGKHWIDKKTKPRRKQTQDARTRLSGPKNAWTFNARTRTRRDPGTSGPAAGRTRQTDAKKKKTTHARRTRQEARAGQGIRWNRGSVLGLGLSLDEKLLVAEILPL